MKRYGLIGDPIAGSFSPALFSAGYGGALPYDLIEGADFLKSWKRFEEDYDGINVTAPFKEEAFRKADLFTTCCGRIGASNLIVKTDDGILADNSDFSGIILSVAEAYIPGIVGEFLQKYGVTAHIKIHQYIRQALTMLFSRKPQALVVGCGGAGKAAAVAAAEMGFDTALMNRTQSRAQEIADRLPEYSFIVDSITDFRAAVRECDLIIYTVPSGIEDISLLEAEDFTGEDRYKWPRPAKVILEANYKTPAFSGDVLGKLREGGAQYVSGRRWLLYQAVTGYSIMTGREPDAAAMEPVMRNQ
jgi:shikimate dehydrogenase